MTRFICYVSYIHSYMKMHSVCVEIGLSLSLYAKQHCSIKISPLHFRGIFFLALNANSSRFKNRWDENPREIPFYEPCKADTKKPASNRSIFWPCCKTKSLAILNRTTWLPQGLIECVTMCESINIKIFPCLIRKPNKVLIVQPRLISKLNGFVNKWLHLEYSHVFAFELSPCLYW